MVAVTQILVVFVKMLISLKNFFLAQQRLGPEDCIDTALLITTVIDLMLQSSISIPLRIFTHPCNLEQRTKANIQKLGLMIR